jgi:hypothetical protein
MSWISEEEKPKARAFALVASILLTFAFFAEVMSNTVFEGEDLLWILLIALNLYNAADMTPRVYKDWKERRKR